MSRLLHAVSLFAMFACVAAHAAPPNITYVVTRTDDPVPNGCVPGDCSLREAVTDAGRFPTHDTVQLAAGTYILKSTLVIRNSVAIVGLGAANTRITTTAALNPALQIDEATQMWVELRDLSLNASGGYELRGIASSCLTLDGVDLPNPDGKVWLEYGYGCDTLISDTHAAGSVSINGSISTTVADSSFGKLTLLQSHAGNGMPYTLDVERVVVDGAAYATGGMRIRSIGDVTVTDTTVQNTRYGLRIEEEPTSMLIDGLTYTNNREPVEVADGALVDIRRSEFVQNTGIDGDGMPGALWVHDADAIVWVEQSTFDRNRGTSDAGGAALVENGAALLFIESTFSQNTFSAAAAGNGARGAAVGYRASPDETILRLIGTTLVEASAYPIGVQGTLIGGTGVGSQVQLRVYNSIVQGSCMPGIVVDHAEGSIITGTGTCGFNDPSNITHATKASLALGTLADHGGPTRTYLPSTSSIAIDTGTEYGCLGSSVDQRGYARRAGVACDAGSVEVGASAP
jgi:hypothetical protein